MKKLHKIIIVLSIFGFLYPCSCMEPPPPGDAYEEADVVFSGEVTNMVISEGGYYYEVTFQIIDIWKGEYLEEITVLTELFSDTCGYPFQINNEYLVYAYSYNWEIYTNICTRTNLLEYAIEDLDYLNGLNIGDINDDGEINVVDVVLLVSYILDDTVNENGDINQDGSLNVIDVVLLVDIILNQEIVPDSGLFVSQQYEEDELTFFYDLVYSERSNMNGLQYSSIQNQAQDQLLDTILLELDIALPPNPENKLLPLVVLIHGGGFSGGSKESRWQDTKDYATLGYIGCTINYRLTPNSYQEESELNQIQAVTHAVEDAMNAIRFLKFQSHIYSIDTSRIVTIGKSAGAFISLVNAIENDIITDLGGVSDYIDISSRVSSSISTGAVIPIEPFNFDEDDASCLIMHSEDYDPVTERTWEGDVIPFYDAIINSGNHAVLVPQPSNSHTVGVGPFDGYSEDIIPFIWNQLNLNEW